MGDIEWIDGPGVSTPDHDVDELTIGRPTPQWLVRLGALTRPLPRLTAAAAVPIALVAALLFGPLAAPTHHATPTGGTGAVAPAAPAEPDILSTTVTCPGEKYFAAATSGWRPVPGGGGAMEATVQCYVLLDPATGVLTH